ncbi:adenylate/guanylate cyclase domain-containing protein [Roseibium algae]|uniref:Adenylate/guanylate cyclase domain-containing protein n=1 Tax=Roseibium algae TaxID=3123038 RepID=A0ABU8TIK0_9HYPH
MAGEKQKHMDVVSKIKGKKRRGRLNMPLTRIISFGFGGFVAIALALVLYLSVLANFKNTFSLLNDKAILITQSMDRQLRDHFQSVEQAVIDLKPFFDDGTMGFDNIDETLNKLSVAISTNNRINVVVLTDLKGDSFGVYKAQNGKLWPFKRQIPVGGEKTYTLPKLTADSGPTWGALVHSDIGQYSNVSVPLVRDGKMFGSLTAASSIKGLGEVIRSLDEGEDTTTFIIASGDQVIVHSDMDVFQTGNVAEKKLPVAISELGDPVLAGLGSGVRLETFQKAAKLGIEVSDVNTPRDNFIVMRSVIPGYSDKPWVIGQYFRGVTISREVHRLRGSAVVGLGALIVAVLIAIWIGRRVASPLKKLAIQSEHVGKLSLDEVVPLPRSRVQELDQVALAFNSMVEGLKAMNIYVPRSLFSKLMRLGGQEAAGAREAELTILFTDIVGFTALSEHMSATETASYLNEHFSILVEAVENEGGTVDKFIGDGMLAFWGAPDARADHAAAAVRTARSIASALVLCNDKAEAQGHSRVRLRMGIHTGTAVVGNVGALDRWNYTVVGDTVNVTDRLQALGREVGANDEVVILASADTASQLPGEQGEERVGEFVLRGRSTKLDVWKLDPFATTGDAVAAVSTTAA